MGKRGGITRLKKYKGPVGEKECGKVLQESTSVTTKGIGGKE